MTSNSGLCSEHKEKKPKLAKITVGRVIVYKFSRDLSSFSVVCLIWSWAVFYGSLSYVYDLKFWPKDQTMVHYCTLVNDRNHYFCFGPIPKLKL